MAYDSEPSVETTTRDRLIRLRDFLAELPPEKFDMGDCGSDIWRAPECGSPACIGGWARMIFFPAPNPYLGLRSIGNRIGLSDAEAEDLFFPPCPHGKGYLATPAQAVRVLDHLLATGEVDWSVAFQ